MKKYPAGIREEIVAKIRSGAGAAVTLALQQGTSLRQVDITALQAMLRKEGYLI